MLVSRPNTASRILIVDDEPANGHLLGRILTRAGLPNVCCLTDPRQLASLGPEDASDLLLLDLHLPYLDGFNLLQQLRAGTLLTPDLPVIVLTADSTREARHRALAEGANDFLTKPFDADEVILRVRNLLELRRLQQQLKEENCRLEARVAARTRALLAAQTELLAHLALAAEYRDDQTGQHAQRVGQLASRLAAELGLPAVEVELIRQAAPLHDVGKIGVPDAILLKPGRLEHAELELVQQHTVIGARILAGSTFEVLRLAEAIASSHHERWDGNGYPQGLCGDAIPIAARIVAVADAVDVMRQGRSYQPARPLPEILTELEAQASRQFDPTVVLCAKRLLPQLEAEGRPRGPLDARRVDAAGCTCQRPAETSWCPARD